jgi:hypothetical protein
VCFGMIFLQAVATTKIINLFLQTLRH